MWAVVVAQLVEQSLPIPEICDSNPVILTIISFNNCIEKTKIKKKEAGNGHLKNLVTMFIFISLPVLFRRALKQFIPDL